MGEHDIDQRFNGCESKIYGCVSTQMKHTLFVWQVAFEIQPAFYQL